jgi:hypothetical protein
MPSFALTGLLGLSEDWKLARSTFSTATSIAIPGTTNTALTPTTHPGLVRNNMAGSESRIHPAPGMLIMPVGADAADEIFRMEVYGAKRYPTSGNDDQFIFTQFLVCTACVICTYTLTFLQADTFACDDWCTGGARTTHHRQQYQCRVHADLRLPILPIPVQGGWWDAFRK